MGIEKDFIVKNGLKVNTDSLTVDANTGNIGVGTDSPTERLHIVGNNRTEGKIYSGNELNNANLVNTLNFSVETGTAGFRAINLIDSSAGIKISRPNDAGNGAFVELQEWDSTITTLKSHAFIVGEAGNLIHRNILGGNHIFQGGSNVERMRIDASGKVGIGTSLPETVLHILSTDSPGGMINDAVGNVAAVYIGRRANGTVSAPAAVVNTDNLLVLAAQGYDGTQFTPTKTRIAFQADEDWSATANGTRISFDTTANGSTVRTERMRITAEGNVGIGTSSPRSILDLVGGTDKEAIINIDGGTLSSPYINFRTSGTERGSVGLGFFSGTPSDMVYSLNDGNHIFRSGFTERMRITSTGNVGIGTSSPQSKLDVFGVGNIIRSTANDGASNFMAFFDATGRKGYFGYGGVSDDMTVANERDGFLRFITNGSTRMTVTSAGDVGIGNMTPTERLHVTGNIIASGTSSTTKNILRTTAGQIEVRAGNTVSFLDLDFNEATSTAVAARFFRNTNTTGTKTVRFHRGDGTAAEDARIAVGTEDTFFGIGGGKVGIGTISPASSLDVVNAIRASNPTGSAAVFIEDGASSFTQNRLLGIFNDNGLRLQTRTDAGVFVSNDYLIETNATGAVAHRWAIANSERMRIDSNGRLGIGTTGPTTLLQVAAPVGTGPRDIFRVSSAAGGSFQIRCDDLAAANPSWTLFTNASEPMAFAVAATEVMRLTPTGSVGIGTSSPDERLHVIGNAKLDMGSATANPRLYLDHDTVTDNANYIQLNRGDAGLEVVSNDNVKIRTNGTERMRITSTGNVGIGTSSPATTLDVNGVASAQILRTGSRSAISVPDHGGTNRTPPLMISGNSFATTIPSVAFYNTTADAGTLNFLRSNTTTVGDHALVSNNNNMGTLQWAASDGFNFRRAAQIQGRVDGTPAENDMPGRLVFLTTPSGSTIPTERMRITSAGNVGIGTSSPSVPLQVNGRANATFLVGGESVEVSGFNYPIQSHSTTDSGVGLTLVRDGRGSPNIRLGHARGTSYGSLSALLPVDELGVLSFRGYDGSNWRIGATIYSEVDSSYSAGSMPGNLIFQTGGSNERMRIDTSGNLLVGTTTAGASNSISTSIEASGLNNSRIFVNHSSSGSSNGSLFMGFGYGGNTIGSITQNSTSSVAYNTSSDYRLKEDVQPLVGASDRVLALNPVNFAWKADGTRVDGFLAHEAQAVVPEAVTGEKDGEEMQAIDQSKLVPLLTAALQESLLKIEKLEARIINLENRI